MLIFSRKQQQKLILENSLMSRLVTLKIQKSKKINHCHVGLTCNQMGNGHIMYMYQIYTKKHDKHWPCYAILNTKWKGNH